MYHSQVTNFGQKMQQNNTPHHNLSPLDSEQVELIDASESPAENPNYYVNGKFLLQNYLSSESETGTKTRINTTREHSKNGTQLVQKSC